MNSVFGSLAGLGTASIMAASYQTFPGQVYPSTAQQFGNNHHNAIHYRRGLGGLGGLETAEGAGLPARTIPQSGPWLMRAYSVPGAGKFGDAASAAANGAVTRGMRDISGGDPAEAVVTLPIIGGVSRTMLLTGVGLIVAYMIFKRSGR